MQPKIFGVPAALLQAHMRSLIMVALTFLASRYPLSQLQIEQIVALLGGIGTMVLDHIAGKTSAPPPPPPQAEHLNGSRPHA